ncbi:hypothetical protein A6U85_16680 [Agrobacterium sp. 13-626]|jgi:hypothetical protein|uniref:DUF596 domain-containing protein n=1 Tax=Rhizobium rhizogenes TaxID=359 RepID=UPI0004D5DEEF|nr:DUF596 domain-containing protein [Rhizobium rhizogenes]OCI94572.1 hypothetical protein A6U85_16680 [Agrobacterium sp. 13-626]KEA04224.1 hypothetical protein CN09_29665 [Rhizobium rhizogenes]NTF69998.1 DUF596 domain-containing protein [Rhizobium rhizogenes]NTG22511.1 DUF596 domain-containing protein [Rhizobium rhizogenes]NTH43274.1 DUF596 domain-containing protein [Rhizobium rhizogenes]
MKKQWEEIVELSEFWAFNGLWLFVRDEYKSFSEARKVFLGIVEELLAHGKIKFSRDGVLLESSAIEQISLLGQVLPVDRREMVLGRAAASSSKPREIEDFDKMAEDAKTAEESLWFFREECPARVVWIRDDGSEEWT